MGLIRTWTVINLDPAVSETQIRGWFATAGIPSCFKFVFPASTNGYWTKVNDVWCGMDCGDWPFPSVPNAIVIFDANDSRFRPLAAGLGWGGATAGCSVVYDHARDSALCMGARVWHEMLHACGPNSDQMDKADKEEFCAWLIDTQSPYASWCSGAVYTGDNFHALLCEYYAFLTTKYFKNECFPTTIPNGDDNSVTAYVIGSAIVLSALGIYLYS